MSKPACGTHVELVSNEAVRVTRCTCGTVHLTINTSGVTLRMQPEAFRNAVAGLRGAVEKLDASQPITATGSTSIN
jgi:hypothetical protein